MHVVIKHVNNVLATALVPTISVIIEWSQWYDNHVIHGELMLHMSNGCVLIESYFKPDFAGISVSKMLHTMH
jgi:hypothetical protein